MGEKPGEADEAAQKATGGRAEEQQRSLPRTEVARAGEGGGAGGPTASEATTVKGSKSNSEDRIGDFDADEDPDTGRQSDPLKGLNVSKSPPPN